MAAVLAAAAAAAPATGCALHRPAAPADSTRAVDGVPLLTALDRGAALALLRRIAVSQGFAIDEAKSSETAIRTRRKEIAGAELTLTAESFPTAYVDVRCTVVVLTATYVRPPDRQVRQLVAPHEPALWAAVQDLSTAFAGASRRCR